MRVKFLLIFIIILFMTGCVQHSAILGPAITGGATGNAYNASLSFGTNQIVSKATGKSTIENLKEIIETKKNDSEFVVFLKDHISSVKTEIKKSR